MPLLYERFLPLLLLLGSNIFMTFAWYGHLRYKSAPLALVIVASWGIAFFEYTLQVPANRIGSAVYSAPQLKGMQEVITLLVFAWFSAWYLGEPEMEPLGRLRADRGGGLADLPGVSQKRRRPRRMSANIFQSPASE